MNKSLTPKRASISRILIIVLTIILLGILGWSKGTNNTSGEQTVRQKEQTYAIFDGTITGMNNGCAHDDICTVFVDGKVIITGSGLSANPDTNIYGATDADLAIGDKVNVKALNSDHGLTLQGCNECHITRGSVRHQ